MSAFPEDRRQRADRQILEPGGRFEEFHMSARPISVLIATPLGEGGMGGIDRIMDEVRRLARDHPPEGMRIFFGTTRGEGNLLFSPLHLGWFLVRMALLRASGNLDVLHINLSSHGSTRRKKVVATWARLLRVPYVVHLHGSRYRQFWNDSPPRAAGAIAELFARAARIVVLGKVWKSFVAEKVPEAGGRIVIIPNATPASALAGVTDEDGRLHLLFLGRVGTRKGVPQLLEALSMTGNRHRWHATIAGDGDLAEMGRMAERLGLAGQVTFPGWVGPDEVRHLLFRSDVLILPSFDENLPMSVIEGMAAGLAIIATPVGAVEDIIIDGETGLLVPVGDAEAIAASLQRLIEQPETRRRLGENARRLHAERLEIGMYFDSLVALWASIVRKPV